MSNRCHDRRAARLASHGTLALVLAVVAAVFATAALLGSGGELVALHWTALGSMAGLTAAGLVCFYVSDVLEGRYVMRLALQQRPRLRSAPRPTARPPIVRGATAAEVAALAPQRPARRTAPVAAEPAELVER